MSNDLADLILQLKSLCIRQARILQQLEQAIAQEGQVIHKIEDHRERQATQVVAQPPPPIIKAPPPIVNATVLDVGDHILHS